MMAENCLERFCTPQSQKIVRIEDSKLKRTGIDGHLLLTHKTKVEAKS